MNGIFSFRNPVTMARKPMPDVATTKVYSNQWGREMMSHRNLRRGGKHTRVGDIAEPPAEK